MASRRVMVSVLSLGAIVRSAAAHAEEPSAATCLQAHEDGSSARARHLLRAAREEFERCGRDVCPSDVAAECASQLKEIAAEMPTVVLSAEDEAGRPLTNVRVTIDGALLTERLEMTAWDVDPGEHVFVFDAGALGRLQRRWVIHEGEKARRESVSWRVRVPETPAPTSEAASPDQRHLGPAAIIVGGAGVLALAAGFLYAEKAIRARDDAVATCPSDPCDTDEGVALWSKAESQGNLSTGLLIGGAVGIAAGTALWWWGAPRGRSGVRASVGPRGAWASGTW